MTTIGSTTDANAANSQSNTAIGKLNADFDLFLKLLTTQMQNQDPLDPMDTSQYTQQLVQYSQVEQSIAQSGTLKEILAGMTTQGLSQASSLIGREVRFDSAVAGVSETGSANWTWEGDRKITKLVANITDADGKLVETRTLDSNAASGSFNWDGTLTKGGKAPAGSYTLSLTALDASGAEVKPTINSLGTVQGVRSANGAITLDVNGASIPASALIRITQGK